MLAEGQAGSLAFSLMPSTSTLEQVVVTGTVIPTALRAVPNAMSVITAKDIERRGITHIDQLFRGDIPGLFAQNQGDVGTRPGQVKMASRGSTKLGFEDALSQPIKTYVDGVELADPSYLGLIDPKSIERIEILTGPQASTIYGSNAINGVMQIFTKRGTTARPQWTANLQTGLIQNDFSAALTPEHDYGAQVSGVEGHASYTAGGSWVYVGPWTPSIHATTTSGFGGVRLQRQTASVDVSVRRTLGINRQDGNILQARTVNTSNGLYAGVSVGGSVPVTNTSSGQTLGLTMTYSPTSWWSHSLTLGDDQTNAEYRVRESILVAPADSLLFIDQGNISRTSVAYTTIAHMSLGAAANMVVTAGADGWHSLGTTLQGSVPKLTGSLAFSAPPVITRTPSHDHGVFVQGQLAMLDDIFLTYGLRAEWNPNYGNDANPNIVPRYGIAYAHDWGSVTTKIRASYGHSTRPPLADQTRSVRLSESSDAAATPFYEAGVNYQLANPNLLPEQQQGGEGGVEVYVGTRGSLVVTRYNQTVDNLIVNAVVDSVFLLPEYQVLYGQYAFPLRQVENLNLGSVRNQGWELVGTLNVGPLTTKGTYSE
jgi:outer membrane receptor protein involved in Fe transport